MKPAKPLKPIYAAESVKEFILTVGNKLSAATTNSNLTSKIISIKRKEWTIMNFFNGNTTTNN